MQCAPARIQNRSVHLGVNVILHPGPAKNPCPIRYMEKYLAVQPNVNGPFFFARRWHMFIALTVFQCFSGVPGYRILGLGFFAREFGIHSFLIGTATFMSESDFSSERMMAIRWWCSSSYLLYVCPGMLH